MSRYSKEQIEQANNVDLVEYLQSHGYELTRESLQYKLADLNASEIDSRLSCTHKVDRWHATFMLHNS